MIIVAMNPFKSLAELITIQKFSDILVMVINMLVSSSLGYECWKVSFTFDEKI